MLNKHLDKYLYFTTGIDTFKGKYFHSRDYKTSDEWRSKRVVVIGIGNSGGDIAVELSRVTKQVGATLLQSVYPSGAPGCCVLTCNISSAVSRHCFFSGCNVRSSNLVKVHESLLVLSYKVSTVA